MTKDHKSFSEISIDTQKVVAELRKAKCGDVVEYESLSAVVSRDIQGPARYVLVAAQRMLLRDDKMVFSTIPKVGIKRLSDTEKISSGYSDITSKLPRMCRRIARKVTALDDFDALPPDVKARHNATLSAVQTVAFMTKSQGMQKLERKITETNSALPTAETLKLFQG